MNLNSEPLITVITSTYNAAMTLGRCLASLENQTYKDFEHIIIDGGSTDGTIDIIENSIKSGFSNISWWVSEPDNGIYNAWNKALPHVRGEWVYFLGADDYLYSSDTLEKIKTYLLKSYPLYPVVYGKVEIISCFNQKRIRWAGEPWDIVKNHFFNVGNSLPHQGLFQHRETFNDVGNFDETYQLAGDYDMLLRVLINNTPLFIDVPIAYMETGGISSLPSSDITNRKEYLHSRRKNQLITQKKYVFHAIFLILWSSINDVSPTFTIFIRNGFRRLYGKEPFKYPTDYR